MSRESDHEGGFTLIEMLISVTVIATLVATSIPTYSIIIKKTQLLAAEITLTNALKKFSVTKEYSPPSGMLADLVVEGYVKEIPNDPWTVTNEKIGTGAEELNDWYYSNDGSQILLYARSHPGRLISLPSFGLPAIEEVPTPPTTDNPPDKTPPGQAISDANKNKNKDKSQKNN